MDGLQESAGGMLALRYLFLLLLEYPCHAPHAVDIHKYLFVKSLGQPCATDALAGTC